MHATVEDSNGAERSGGLAAPIEMVCVASVGPENHPSSPNTPVDIGVSAMYSINSVADILDRFTVAVRASPTIGGVTERRWGSQWLLP